MIGQSIGHYKILDKLGAGGMGEVHRAEDTTLGREVAIKVLPDAFTSDPELSFLRTHPPENQRPTARIFRHSGWLL